MRSPSRRSGRAGPAPRARARLLELKSDDLIFMNIAKLFGLENRPDDPVAVDARAKAHAHYAAMEAELGDKDYLAGPMTYADIGFFMAQFYGERKGALMTSGTPRLLAWRERMVVRPAVRHVIGRMGAWLKSEGRGVPDYIAEAVRKPELYIPTLRRGEGAATPSPSGRGEKRPPYAIWCRACSTRCMIS